MHHPKIPPQLFYKGMVVSRMLLGFMIIERGAGCHLLPVLWKAYLHQGQEGVEETAGLDIC